MIKQILDRKVLNIRKVHKDACAREFDERCVFIRVLQIVADGNSSFMRTTLATVVLFLNIAKNADQLRNEVPIKQFSSWKKSRQIFKPFSRRSGFYEWFVLFVSFYALSCSVVCPSFRR